MLKMTVINTVNYLDTFTLFLAFTNSNVFFAEISYTSFYFLLRFGTAFLPIFDYKITYVNSQRENTNSKGDFVL